MILDIPDWCKIGKYIEFQMYDPTEGKAMWFKEEIISYTEDGFFHQAPFCPVHYHKFSDYGKTVRECKNMKYRYRGFILYECNDDISYNVFLKNSDGNGEHLICTAGSYGKATQWVDEWYKKNRQNRLFNRKAGE